MFRALLFAGVAALATLSDNRATAQEPVSVQTLEIYAAFAKLESNIAETTLLVALAAALADEAQAERGEILEDFRGDAAQVSEYVELLRKAELTDDQREVVAAFDGLWAAHVAKGEALISEPGSTPGHTERLLTFWEEVDELDDLVDDKLEKLRERVGASW